MRTFMMFELSAMIGIIVAQTIAMLFPTTSFMCSDVAQKYMRINRSGPLRIALAGIAILMIVRFTPLASEYGLILIFYVAGVFAVIFIEKERRPHYMVLYVISSIIFLTCVIYLPYLGAACVMFGVLLLVQVPGIYCLAYVKFGQR